MAHTTSKVNFGTKFAVAIINFTAYVQGGEQFTIAEFGLTAPLVGVWFLQTSGDGNPSQYVQYVGAGIMKCFSIAQPDQELSTGPVAFSILAVVQGS
jgi:hypothetical protein